MSIRYCVKTCAIILLIFTTSYMYCNKIVAEMSLLERILLCTSALPEDIENAFNGYTYSKIHSLLKLSADEQNALTSMLIIQYPQLYPVVYNLQDNTEADSHVLIPLCSEEFNSDHRIDKSPQQQRFMYYVHRKCTETTAVTKQYTIMHIVGAIHSTPYHTFYAAQVTLQDTLDCENIMQHTIIVCDLDSDIEQFVSIDTTEEFDHVEFKHRGANVQDIIVVFSNNNKTLCIQPKIYNNAKNFATLEQMLFLLMLEKFKNNKVILPALYWSYTNQLSNTFLAIPSSVHMTLNILNSFITPQVTLAHIYTMLHHAGYIYNNNGWKSPTCELL